MPTWSVIQAALARFTLSHFAIAALALFSIVQTIRLEGFNLWPIKSEGWKAKAERYRADLEAVKAAQVEAAAKARAARLVKEAEYTRKMEQANAELEELRAEWRTATDRYIAANRVRPQAPRGASGGTGADPRPATSEGPDRSDPVPELADGLVLVSEEDLSILVDNTARLVVAQEWAEGLSEE